MEKAKETGTDQELMRSMKVSKAVAAMAIPSVISSLVTVVYNMADTFFVGQTGDALQVAAVSLTNPIFILLMAFANMFGMGGSAVASMAMGEGKPKKVKNTTAFITYASLAVGIIIAVILFAFMSPILHIFGANTETYEYAKGYIHYIAWGAPFIIWSAAASFVVRAEGASKEAMIGSMVGTIANIVLDPLFISGLHMGAAGAAIATTIGNILASLYFVWYFLKRSGQLSILPKDFTLGENIPQRVCTTGFPTAIFSVLMSVSTIVVNQILVKYGNAPVAAIGIVEGRLDMSLTSSNILALFPLHADICALLGIICTCHFSNPPYFFLLATVRFGPLQVRALVLVRWPRQGRFLRWRVPRKDWISTRRLMSRATLRRRSPSTMMFA